MTSRIDNTAIEQLFTSARTHYRWADKTIPEALLRELYDIAKWPPTSMNCNPARFVFVMSEEGKQRLKPGLIEGNVEKTMTAPLTVIVAIKPDFYEELPELFPANPAAATMYSSNGDFARDTAFRNSTLQGAYMIMAARALGLDCGPMSGFFPDKINQAFFSDSGYLANFLINIGYAGEDSTRPRGPRLAFDRAVQVV